MITCIAARTRAATGEGRDEPSRETGAIRDQLSRVLGRDRPDPRQEQQRKLEEERERQRQLDRGLGWEL